MALDSEPAASRRSRFDLSGEAQAALLAESRRFKGESLWQDAWRRLKRNRGAWWSLVFLGVFVGLSVIAPVLPLASPMALDPQKEPQSPLWPWEASPRLAENAPPGKKFDFGTAATKSLGAFLDNGWRHRTFVDVAVAGPWEEGQAIPDEAALVETLAEVSGRRPIAYVKSGDAPGTAVVRLAVPLQSDDRARVDHRPTGHVGEARVTVFGESGSRREAWIELDGFVKDERAQGLAARGTEEGLEVNYTVADDGPDIRGRRFLIPVERSDDIDVTRLTVNGVEILSESEASALASQFGELDALDDDLNRLERVDADGSRTSIVTRGDYPAVHQFAFIHADLGQRFARAMDDRALPHEFLELSHVDGIWAVNPFDRALLWVRGKLLGTWQIGPLLGTDNKGRDLLARIVWGSRISIQVSVVATLCSLLIGVTYGAFAGLMGGRVDNLMMRIVDVLYSVPFIFVVIFLITLINEYRTELAEYGIGYMTVFYLVVGAIYWLTMARVVRGQVLSLKNQEFIEAARVIGASTPRILFVHLVPNVLSVVIVYLTLTIPAVMLFEAFLSFLGLGVEPPMVSWGLLAVDGTEAISAVKIFWWVVVFPALAMGSTLLALNVLGDGLRDALDPKLRGKD